MEQKNEKKITAFESEAANSHNPEQDTCNWRSMFYETLLRFNLSLRETFSKWISLRVMKKFDESALMQILQEFGTL